jgi:hypothetical protein
VPSAEQADNRRRGRAENRIPQIAQDRIGLLTFTVRNKATASAPAFAAPVMPQPGRDERQDSARWVRTQTLHEVNARPMII